MLRILISRIDSLGKHANSLKSRSFQSAIQIVQIVAAQLCIRKIPEVRNPISTLTLGEQQSTVRCGNQAGVVCRASGKISYAKTRASLMLRKVDLLVQPFDYFEQPVGRLDGVGSSYLRHYDDEFLAAIPGDVIYVPALLPENFTDVAKHRVSLLMAELVIYLLEEIEIYHDQGERALITPGPVNFVVKVPLEMTVVLEPRQTVSIRHFLGFLVMVFKLRVLALKFVMSIAQHILFFTKREKKGWEKPGGEIKNLKIIQDCYAIYRRIEEELNLTHVAAHVGTEGNELADRMAMLGAQRKEEELRHYQETIDMPTLLKMGAG